MKPRLTIIVGPTASGKSDLALALAEREGGEIVSADSVQIYRQFDIGSAKPSLEEQRRVPHHLIDTHDGHDAADVSRFVEMADRRIEEIHARGKPIVVCGGTFLWVRALVYGLAKAPPANPEIREKHQQLAEQFGRAHLHEKLATVDPALHEKLAPNDLVRVSRALEVHELTGTPLSQIQAEHGFREPRYPVDLIGVERSRAELHERIAQRTATMFEQGLVDEVRSLRAQGYADARPLRSVGYRQVSDALAAESPVNEEELRDSVAQATRGFVRSQMTWLRSQAVRWVQGLDGV